MALCFVGTSHAARTLAQAAVFKGCTITNHAEMAHLVFVSEDTPTDDNGVRDLEPIRALIKDTYEKATCPIIVTSQVPPGFMRSLNLFGVIHQAETLRIEDAMQRALHPEMLIVGTSIRNQALQPVYIDYLKLFDAPILMMTYEEAEFTKMAINAFLISQVETSCTLSRIAKSVGAEWSRVAAALHRDSRIGKYAYLHPGEWYKSKHLLRDYMTLLESAPDDDLLQAWRCEF